MSFFRPYVGSFPISQKWANGAWGPNGEGGHPGTDYAMPIGTPLRACADYEVIYAGPAEGFGNHAICLWFPQLGAAATMGHCSAHYVGTGHRGNAGEVLGASGNEGWSTGPHLHFEIRYIKQAFGGNPPNVDSEQWLRFFEALQTKPGPRQGPLTAAEIAKVKAIQQAIGVGIDGHWGRETDMKLQALRWHYLTPPNAVHKDAIVGAFQRAMGLPPEAQDMVWGPTTDKAYNLCRLVFLGR